MNDIGFLASVLFICMLFCHIVDDYYLQGFLASAKQKSWWEKNSPDKLYKYDYIMALIEHAFSWTFMIHIPLLVLIFLGHLRYNTTVFFIVFIVNLIIHGITDNLKANCHKISLRTDQMIHILQVYITWSIYFIFYL